jgi:hypothetical protein
MGRGSARWVHTRIEDEDEFEDEDDETDQGSI